MKKLILIAAICVSAASCTEPKKAQIIGTFSGVDKDTVYLELISTKERKIIDSVVTSKTGNFKFKVNLATNIPTFCNIKTKNSTIPIIISAGEKIIVNSIGDLSHNYTVEGSDDTQLLKNFNTLYNNGISSMDSLSNLFYKSTNSENEQQNLLKEYSQLYFKIKRDHIAFIVSNAGSMSALYALYQRLPNDETLFSNNDDLLYYRMVADSLSAKYPLSPHVIALQKEVESRNQAAELANTINQNIDSPINFPDIELPDNKGKTTKLSSLNGKVILIDFWSMVDNRSKILNAELKEIYNEFSTEGFEIYQVSLDNLKIDWMNSVKTQRLPWVSVIDERGTAGLAAMLYNVVGVPSNTLIDKNGNIVARNIFGDALKKKVAELTK